MTAAASRSRTRPTPAAWSEPLSTPLPRKPGAIVLTETARMKPPGRFFRRQLNLPKPSYFQTPCKILCLAGCFFGHCLRLKLNYRVFFAKSHLSFFMFCPYADKGDKPKTVLPPQSLLSSKIYLSNHKFSRIIDLHIRHVSPISTFCSPPCAICRPMSRTFGQHFQKRN